MVYKTKFLKQPVVTDYVPSADETKTWELTDQALAAIWITIEGTIVAKNWCINDLALALTSIDVWFGGFNVLHYGTCEKAVVMNCLLKQAWPYLMADSQTVDDLVGFTFPILFGAPYINEKMCLPKSLSNRKTLTLGIDIATAKLDVLHLQIAEVLLPDATPAGFIKQEQVDVNAMGTGDKDLILQRNWDLLKLLLYSTTVPATTAYTSTIERAGLEIDDFAFGYKSVAWEILHGELMDELEGAGPVEDHVHMDTQVSPAQTDYPYQLEHWIKYYGIMDFFYNKDLKWRAPLAGASTAKVKLNLGVDEAFSYAQANYVPTSRVR